MPDSDSYAVPYIVLVDTPDDWPETVWVEAATEDEARDRAAEFCGDEHGDPGYRPTGPAVLELVEVPYDHDLEEHEQDPRVGERVELWRIHVD